MEHEKDSIGSQTRQRAFKALRAFFRLRKNGFKIAWKITILVTLVFTFLAVINIAFNRNRIKTIMEEEFLSKGKTIAYSLSIPCEDKLTRDDIETVQLYVETYQSIAGVKYVYIVDDKEQVVAHTFDVEFPGDLHNHTHDDGVSVDITEIEHEKLGQIVDIAVPILYGAAGWVHVGMSRENVVREMFSVTIRLTVQFLAATILGVVFLHLLLVFLFRPLKKILAVLGRVGDGDLATQAEVTSNDEFAILATGLNSMIKGLKEGVQRIRQAYKSIDIANIRISEVYGSILKGSEIQETLASETTQVVKHSKELGDQVTEGVHVLKKSVGTSFSSIMEMGSSVENVSSMSESLFKSVRQADSAQQGLSNSMSEISHNLATLSRISDETASAMSEMGASIIQVSTNTEHTRKSTLEMTDVAEKGMKASKEALTGIFAIRDSSLQVIQMITTLTDRIEEIDEILQFITDITGKTNLLSLNAAIIAAQAGERGKAFGVVADEIKEMAQNTKSQTNRISEVIGGIRAEVEQTEKAIKESGKLIEDGVILTEQTGSSLDAIQASSQQVSQLVLEIARTSEEQSLTSRRIVKQAENFAESVKNIQKAGETQESSNKELLEMSGNIRAIAEKVNMSTQDQLKTSQMINADLVKIEETVQEIAGATDEQSRSEEGANNKIGDLSGVIESNREAVEMLQEVIEDLKKSMESLQIELSAFDIGDNVTAKASGGVESEDEK